MWSPVGVAGAGWRGRIGVTGRVVTNNVPVEVPMMQCRHWGTPGEVSFALPMVAQAVLFFSHSRSMRDTMAHITLRAWPRRLAAALRLSALLLLLTGVAR